MLILKNKLFSTRTKNGPHTKTESIYIPHTKPSEFRPEHWSQVNFDPRSKTAEVKSVSIPTLKRSQFCMPPDTKTKLISIHTLN